MTRLRGLPRAFWTGLLVGVLLGAVGGGLLAAGNRETTDAGATSSTTGAASKPVPAPDAPTTSASVAPSSKAAPETDESPSGKSDDEDEPVAPVLPTRVDRPAAPLPSQNEVTCPPATVQVGNADELTAALAAARPGTSIHLRAGTYEGAFVATTSGTEEQPIWLCGSPDSVLDGGGIKKGYGLHLAPAEYWRVVGFTVQNAQKGVVADGTRGAVIQGLTVQDIGDEAVHLRSFSTGSAVINNTIRRTGLRRDKFGEGVYVGSAVSNWPTYSADAPDRSDNNLVHGNHISQTGSECVDVKEGTTGGVVSGNTFDGSGMTGADSWVDVKGNSWVIEGNTGVNAPLDGFQTHEILDGWGRGNTFRDNTADVAEPGLGFHLAPVLDNVVECNNRTGKGAEPTSSGPCRR